MSTINRLSSVDALQPGDLIPVWDGSNGDTRKASLTTLLAFIESNFADPDYSTRIVAPNVDGFNVDIGNTGDSSWLIVNPVLNYTTGSITLPSTAYAVNDQEITVVFTAQVSSFSITGAGATVLGAPTQIGTYDSFRVRYNAAQLTWYTLDTTGDGSGSGTSSIVRQDFTGDGVVTTFALANAPAALGNELQVFIDGVYQERAGYSVSGNDLVFSEAPPVLSTIEVLAWGVNDIGATTANLVTYTPAGTGAVATTVQDKLRESVSVKDFGAVGDGVADDYAACQAAIDSIAEGGVVHFPAGVYKLSDTLKIIDNDPADNHFITLRGDGAEATWLVHSGTQTTGCVQIVGSVYWVGAASSYYHLNNGASHVKDMALGSNYGPALYCKFANKMRHKNILLYSAGTATASLTIESCIESFFEDVDTSLGNTALPQDMYALVIAALPTGNVTLPLNSIRCENIAYNDGVNGSATVVNGEIFFNNCRSDGDCTDNAVDLRGIAGGGVATETFLIHFSQCKFTSGDWISAAPYTPWVVNINGSARVTFSQCNLEPKLGPSGQAGGSLRISSNLGPASVILDQCYQESAGFVDIGVYEISNDPDAIDFTMVNCDFYGVRVSPFALGTSSIKTLHMDGNVFNINLDGNFSTARDSVPGYNVTNNFFGSSRSICSYSGSNNSGIQIVEGLDFTGQPTLGGMTSKVIGNGEEGLFTPVVTSLTGAITTYSASGIYNRIGNQVTFTFAINLTDAGTGGSALVVTLPYDWAVLEPIGSGRDNTAGLALQVLGAATNNVYVFKYDGTTTIATGKYIMGTISYRTA